tara:strand:+ start:488 stop:1171 length:684 start_codon:yes stop_codon:yes gene_type:complete
MGYKMKIVTIVQARQTSKRFPNKVLKTINGHTVIEIILKRLMKSKFLKSIVVAIPKNKKNLKLFNYLKKKNYKVFRGSEKNVLDRYYNAAKANKADIIIRVTGDCPLVDTNIVEKGLKIFLKKNYDFVSNTIERSYPDGLDISIFSFDLLKKSWKSNQKSLAKEHVTINMKKDKSVKKFNFKNNKDFSNYRWTLDHKKDYKKIKKIFDIFYPDIFFSWKKILAKGIR